MLTKIETIGEVAAATSMTASVESATSGSIYGGDDTISVGSGNNVIVGGLGADKITTGNGNNVVLGDSGTILYTAAGQLQTVVSTFGGAAVGGVGATADTGTSSNDTITLGSGNNIVIGGAGADLIVLAVGADIILGDDGQINYALGVLTSVVSTDGALGYGGNDTIEGPTVNGLVTYAGSGDSVVFGGIGSDTILIGGPNNVILGDDGTASYASNGNLITVQTTDAGIGAADTITATGSSNVIMGGAGGDLITLLTTAAGVPTGNVVLGDDGVANFTGAILTQIYTQNVVIDAGADTIIGGDGDNIAIGGSGNDTITLGAGSNIVMGDNAEIDFSMTGVLTRVVSTHFGAGGEDTIKVGSATATGKNLVFGGTLADSITITGNGANVVFGDDGEADFTNGYLSDVTSTDVIQGGNDTITINGGGANVVLGGVGADKITITGAGANVVLGDNGYVNFNASFLLQAYTTNPTSTWGGTVDTGTTDEDTIVVGDGANTIFGGEGADNITAGNGGNFIFGDFGQALWTGGIITTLTSTDLSLGGDDTIKGGNGANVVIGGIGANQITLGDGNNAVVGGDGFAQFTPGGVLQAIYNIAPTATFGGTVDTGTSLNNTIVVGNGNNVVLAGVGADHITAGNGNNYLFGDDGEAQYIVVNGVNAVSRVQSTFQIFGGADVIVAGDGSNAIAGGVGADTITAGNGLDNLLLGDNAEFVQAFSPSGALVRNADGTLHRDIVAEEIAQVIGSVLLDDASDVSTLSASALVGANLVMLAGAFNADGSQVILPAGGTRAVAAWEVEALLLSLTVDGDDSLTSGSGNGAVLIGQGGSNTLTAKGGDDYLFGNYASSTSPFSSDIPYIVDADVIVGSPGNATIAANLPAGGLIVVPSMMLQPTALTYENPQLLMAPPGFGELAGVAEGGNISIGGGQSLQVYASIVPSLLNGSPGLPGSNTINGGNGNDAIFGNFGQIGALYGTGISVLDQQLATLSSDVMGVLANFSALSSAQYMLNVVNSGGTTAATIATANNTINVGSGHNLVFGNAGFYVEQNISFARSATGSITTDALNLNTFLLDFEEVTSDTSAALQQLGAGVDASFAATAAGKIAAKGNWQNGAGAAGAYWGPTMTGVLNLRVGDNTITATSGGDSIIAGQVGYVDIQNINTTTAYWSNGVPGATINNIVISLLNQQNTFNTALTNELSKDFSYNATAFALDQALFNYRGGINVAIGDNVIVSGGASGANIIVGASAMLINLVTGPGTTINQYESVFNTASPLAPLMNGASAVVNAAATSWRLTSEVTTLENASLFTAANFIFTGSTGKFTIDNETVTARLTSDLVYGNSAEVFPNMVPNPSSPANFLGYNNSNAYGPQLPTENKINGTSSSALYWGVYNSAFFAKLGTSTIITGPNIESLLAVGMIAPTPLVTSQYATRYPQIPATLELSAPIAPSLTGALTTYFYTALFPPLDPTSPLAAAAISGASYVTLAASAGVGAIRTAANDHADASLVIGDAGSGEMDVALASFEANADALASTDDGATDNAGLMFDASAPFGFDGQVPIGRSTETIRAFIDSEIVVAVVEDEDDAQSWVFDDETGAFTLHEARAVVVTPEHGGAQHQAATETVAFNEAGGEFVGHGWLGGLSRLRGVAARWFDA